MEWITLAQQPNAAYVVAFLTVMRFVAPILGAVLLWRCGKRLLTFRKEPEIWAWLCLRSGERKPLTHWENVIGRHRRCDVTLKAAKHSKALAKNHAVLTRNDYGAWFLTDISGKGNVQVNAESVTAAEVEDGDVITIAGQEMTLRLITEEQENRLAELRTRGASGTESACNLLILSVLQALTCIGFLMGGAAEHTMTISIGFGGILVLEWLLLLFYTVIRKPSFELETIAFFLCTMGMAAIATVKPGETVKQLIALVLGVIIFIAVGWSARDLERVKKIRYVAAVTGVVLLVITLLFGKEYYGAKNWLVIGPLSIQPSELSKVCFVYVGASTLARLMNKRNLIFFIGYTLLICGCLALMNDFGTALIFFVAFLMIAYLRSGSVGTVGLAVTALGFAGTIALKLAPHALRRFSMWRHIWEDPFGAGYQQTRALICTASGGLFGLGINQGWMKNLFAADSDVVFATIAEEWGLLMSVLMVVGIVIPALFAMRNARICRSSFYVIAACTAGAILLVQTSFNVLGTVDVLPLTGVTFPFVSNGGSSMMCAWGLLAYIKAADTRQSASFAVADIGRR